MLGAHGVERATVVGLLPRELAQIQQMLQQQRLQNQQLHQQFGIVVCPSPISVNATDNGCGPRALGSHDGMVTDGGDPRSGDPLEAATGEGAGANHGELAQYKNYVAALQMQQAAIANLGVGADGKAEYSDHPLGPRTTGGQPRLGFRNEVMPPHDPKRRFVGSVFKWDDDAGWGFLSCLDARKVYGKDVFLHKAEIGGVADLYKQRKAIEVKNGDWVEFSVEISRDKPRARDVLMVTAPEEFRSAQKSSGITQATPEGTDGRTESRQESDMRAGARDRSRSRRRRRE